MQPIFTLTINDFHEDSHKEITIKTKLNHTNINIITIDDISLLCYGHIYNKTELFDILQIKPITDCSEYEIIIWLYKKYGIVNTLQLLDGIFSFILVDNNIYNENFKIFIARDIFGVKPMYFIKHSNDIITFSNNINEIKKNTSVGKDKNKIVDFLPGSYTEYNLSSKVFSKWIIKNENDKYYYYKISYKRNQNQIIPKEFDILIKSYSYLNDSLNQNQSEFKFQSNIYKLIHSVNKICNYLLNNNKEFTCLLNEKKTSLLLLILICEYYKNNNINQQINVCCIGNKQLLDYNRIIIENIKIYNNNICYIESVTNGNENPGPLFIKLKETKPTIKYIFTDIGCLEEENNNSIIDYECNVKKSLEQIYIKLSFINEIYNLYDLNPIFPFLDEQFINDYN
jgi:hypothetical protein